MRRRLVTFYRRRVRIPVDSAALVLDVGSGDRPHWRADVLLDRFPTDAHENQRSGGRAARVNHPLFDADADDMPFDDKVFDFVFCSHLLEHVVDPAAVIEEMCRVGKAGYIEVPHVGMAKISDFPSHLWWCRLEGDTLVFTAKDRPYSDPDIHDFVTTSALAPRLDRLFGSVFEHCIVAISWTGSLDYRVEGAPSEAFVSASMASHGRHRSGHALAGRALTAVLAAGLRGRKRSDPVRFNQIMKRSWQRSPDEILRNRVYSVGDTSPHPSSEHIDTTA